MRWTHRLCEPYASAVFCHRYCAQLMMQYWIEPHVDTTAWEFFDLSCTARDVAAAESRFFQKQKLLKKKKKNLERWRGLPRGEREREESVVTFLGARIRRLARAFSRERERRDPKVFSSTRRAQDFS